MCSRRRRRRRRRRGLSRAGVDGYRCQISPQRDERVAVEEEREDRVAEDRHDVVRVVQELWDTRERSAHVRFSAERARVCAVLVASTLRDVGFLVSKK